MDIFKDLKNIGQAFAMEFLGTFALVFFGGWAVFSADGKPGVIAAALGHGLVLGIFVFLAARISGGHFNPAVTLGLTLTGDVNPIKTVAYWIAQTVGSVLAGVALESIRPDVYKNSASEYGFPHLEDSVSKGDGFYLEFVATFFFVFTIYGTAVHFQASPAVCGAVIGGFLALAIVTIGPLTGAALNPVRTFGPALYADNFDYRGWWIYYVAPAVGGALGPVIFKAIFDGVGVDEEKGEKIPDQDPEAPEADADAEAQPAA